MLSRENSSVFIDFGQHHTDIIFLILMLLILHSLYIHQLFREIEKIDKCFQKIKI